VNSALYRARVTLEKHYYSERQDLLPLHRTDDATNTLLARYLRAWESDDVDGLVALLKEDATLSMPPVPSWYRGHTVIRALLLAWIFPTTIQRRWRLLPTRANGQLAFATYRSDGSDPIYRAHGIQIVTLDHSHPQPQIADITAFLKPSLITAFGLPPQLPE